MRKILLIDDDETLAMLLKALLEQHGYDLHWGDRPSKGMALLKSVRPELLLLDVMLPEKNGFDVVKELREQGDTTPIIMLTARGAAPDRIGGLKLGADDYLAKPFDHLELVARVEAVLRRTPAAESPSNGLDRERRTLRLGGTEFALTSMEYRLLDALTSAPGRVYSRTELMGLLDEAGALESFDRAIDSHMSRLRNKIEADPRNPRHLMTSRGMGYRFQW
ncbi:MAG: two component transcriptional regulator, winged helix family [Cyanobacteria bacterium RYN_339]|nr:two component transcriptional regulator, winged helix family [Cyanobacteria bacterium RYN_339]